MKKLLLILFFSSLSFGQTKEELQLCLLAQTNSFSSDTEAENALDRILGVIGASQNFVLTPCSEINNAIATTYKGIRYILYDKAFMRLINSRTNDWSSLTILAHEVGHHINGHSRDLILAAGGVVEPKTLAVRRKQELEADEFAGFIMAKLGASLNQALSFTEIFVEKDDTYSTHPSKSKRVNAIKIGYKKARVTSRNNDYVVNNSTMSVEQYYNIGRKKVDSKDYYGAIQDFNQAIRIKPDYALAYNNRGIAKKNLKDYYGAIADYVKVIELEPNSVGAYSNRGIAKAGLKDYSGAIADYSKAIEIDPYFYVAYYNRGNAKENLGDLKGAIADYDKTIEIKPDYTKAYYNRGLTKDDLGDFKGAIADYDKTIELNPNSKYYAFYRRGTYKGSLKDYYGAIADFSKVIELKPDYTKAYNALAWYLHLSGNSKKALIICKKGIEINPNIPILYVSSGEIKLGIDNSGEIQQGLGLNDKLGACNDWKKVLSIVKSINTEPGLTDWERDDNNVYRNMALDYLSKYCN